MFVTFRPASTAKRAPASTASKAPAKTTSDTEARKVTKTSTGTDGRSKRKTGKETYSYIYKGTHLTAPVNTIVSF